MTNEYLVTPGPSLSLPGGRPGVEMRTYDLDPEDRRVQRYVREGRLLEVGTDKLVLGGLDEAELRARLQGDGATVEAVLAAVGDDAELAKLVVAAEKDGKGRQSIIKPLQGKIDNEENSE